MEAETTFGAWLRQQRRQMDWTQAELAQRIGYSVATIRKLERNELRPSKELAETLAHSFDVAVTQHSSLIAFARSAPTKDAAQEKQASHAERRSNLPAQLIPFFGRTAEIVELIQLLTHRNTRLVTIVGPGGMGKTRLALEVARSIHNQNVQRNSSDHPNSTSPKPNFADGVYFVALAPIREPEQIVPAIAEAINLRFLADSRSSQQQLLDYLRHKKMLLVLDNFEHLQNGADFIIELLQAAAALRILVTSRERLHLGSETLFVLESMVLPSAVTLPDVLSYSAVQLFVETAQRVRPKFTVTVITAQAIVRICQLVGGMPLGIILAAAWVEVLSPDEIVCELSQGFDFLAAELRDLPERQRNMRAVLTQSWQRLSAAEQAVFMRLAVFRGGFTRTAAEQVAGASLRIMSTLVNKSLIQSDVSGRYTIHELLRQFAETALADAGQTTDAQTAHCAYYVDFLHQRADDLKGRRQVAALDEIEAEFENVRAAWQWAVEHKLYSAVDDALESLYWFCEMRSRFQEEKALLHLARTQLAPAAGEPAHPIWGRVLGYGVGFISAFEAPAEAKARLEIALALAHQQESPADRAFCLLGLALALQHSSDAQSAIPYFEQSMIQYQALGERFYLAHLLKNFGAHYFALGQPDKATALIKQSVELCLETGDLTGLADSLGALGWIAYNNGRYSHAEAHWQERYQLLRQLRTPHTLSGSQFEFAWLALFNRGDLDTVRLLTEQVQTVAINTNSPGSKHRMLLLTGFLAGLREDYGAAHQFFKEIYPINRSHPFNVSWQLIGLCLTACGLNDLPALQEHLIKLLNISLTQQWPANTAKGLTFAAILAAKSGRLERATELLGLVFHHSLSPKGWLTHWPLLARVRMGLEARLTPERFASAWTYGAQLDLMATAEAVATELTATPTIHPSTYRLGSSADNQV